jgi:flagellar basal body-associated protein FliL
MPMRGGCGPAHRGSLCISIIILIIVIILIIMVCCSYNYNNYYNQPPPPRLQNPGAAAALAYKYKMNGGMNKFNVRMVQD